MKRLVKESLQEFLGEHTEVIPGGKGEGLSPEDVDPKEFLVGIAVEKEHAKEEAYAQEIALDHLAENPKYYSEGMKKGIFDEPAAINLYKKYFIDKEEPEIKESLNEMGDTNAKYDFSYAHEKVIETYHYCGFNVKVASMNSERFGEMYYAIADIGEPLMTAPHMHGQIHAAKKEIEKFIDKYNGEKNTIEE